MVPCFSKAAQVLRGFDSALAYRDTPRWNSGAQAKRSFQIHLECFEVAIVNADDSGAGRKSALEFGLVMNLYQRGNLQAMAKLDGASQVFIGKRRHDEQQRIRPRRHSFVDLVILRMKSFRNTGKRTAARTVSRSSSEPRK